MSRARRSRFWLFEFFRARAYLVQVDLDVRHLDDFLAPALHDTRAERVPRGGVERLQGLLVPAGHEEGEVQEDSRRSGEPRSPPRLVGDPDPTLFSIVREDVDLLTENRPRGEGSPSKFLPGSVRKARA